MAYCIVAGSDENMRIAEAGSGATIGASGPSCAWLGLCPSRSLAGPAVDIFCNLC